MARGKIQFENLHFENPLTRFAVYQIIRNILNNTRYTWQNLLFKEKFKSLKEYFK